MLPAVSILNPFTSFTLRADSVYDVDQEFAVKDDGTLTYGELHEMINSIIWAIGGGASSIHHSTLGCIKQDENFE
jgi:hypothetical protein